MYLDSCNKDKSPNITKVDNRPGPSKTSLVKLIEILGHRPHIALTMKVLGILPTLP